MPDLPDTRGFALLGLFLLVAFILGLIALNPSLASVQLFGTIATSIVTGGFIVALNFFFGSSKGSSDKDATIAKSLDKKP